MNLDPIATVIKQTLSTLGRRRSDIISAKLCDEALKRLAPSLRAYKGCQIIDVAPGVGLWSSKVHELVKPSRHILMEPDERYMPCLKPLLEQPNSTYEFFSSAEALTQWHAIEDLTFSDQRLLPKSAPRPTQGDSTSNNESMVQPNRSILVLANTYTSAPLKNLKSLAIGTTLEDFWLHRFTSSALEQTYLHSNGHVRLLAWISEAEARPVIYPYSVVDRGVSNLNKELLFNLTQIVGGQALNKFHRPPSLELSVNERVLQSMKDKGIVSPPEYQRVLPSQTFMEFLYPKDFKTWTDELLSLQADYDAGVFKRRAANKKIDPRWTRLNKLKSLKQRTEKNARSMEIFLEREQALLLLAKQYNSTLRFSAMHKSEYRVFEKTRLGLMADIHKLKQTDIKRFWLLLEEKRAAKVDPPVLMWDRRTAEPLVANEEEFYPNIPLSLMDFQPKPFSRKLCQPDHQLFLRFLANKLWGTPSEPVEKAISRLGSSASKDLFYDLPRFKRHPELAVWPPKDKITIRSLSPEAIMEIFDVFCNWPFRPGTKWIESMKSLPGRGMRGKRTFT